MTIDGWILFAFFAICFAGGGLIASFLYENLAIRIVSPIAGIVISVLILFGMLWYYENTASGQRALTDQKSELANGLERVVRVYTADGDIIAEYEGTIDIEGNDGGYVLFDYNGKRYTYYNCFVESIAEIGG